MKIENKRNYYAFNAQQIVASGPLLEIILKLKSAQFHSDIEGVLLFDEGTGRQFDVNFSGTKEDVLQRYGIDQEELAGFQLTEAESDVKLSQKKGRGRPKLGVVGREVTLLPRHWQWLDSQRGGASATLRRLIDETRKAGVAGELIRQSQDSANRFMYSMAGDMPGFEEAVRALYARDRQQFERETGSWPLDIANCARKYAKVALN